MAEGIKGKLFRIANGRQSYELYELQASHLEKIAELIRDEFGYTPSRDPIGALDSIWIDFRTANGHDLTLAWDNWSGVMIFADSESGDAAVREIGAYLDNVVPATKWPGAQDLSYLRKYEKTEQLPYGKTIAGTAITSSG